MIRAVWCGVEKGNEGKGRKEGWEKGWKRESKQRRGGEIGNNTETGWAEIQHNLTLKTTKKK